jgi:hypothetical protein
MSIKLKALGLALVAALAVGAVGVMGATASTGGHFISEQSHTIIKAEQVSSHVLFDHELGIGITCKKASFEGTSNAITTTELTITPHYTECSGGGDASVDVTMNGCAYVFTVNTSPATSDNTTHVECPAAKVIEVHVDPPIVGTCTITIKAQTPLGGLTYEAGSSGGKSDISSNITISGIHAVKHESGFGCFGSAGTSETATLSGTATVKGFTTEGAAVGISAT